MRPSFDLAWRGSYANKPDSHEAGLFLHTHLLHPPKDFEIAYLQMAVNDSNRDHLIASLARQQAVTGW
jgi:hypothetical protein